MERPRSMPSLPPWPTFSAHHADYSFRSSSAASAWKRLSLYSVALPFTTAW
jgi:hypothetical protein